MSDLCAEVKEGIMLRMAVTYWSEPVDTLVSRPSKPHQSRWVEKGPKPSVLAHSVFRLIDQLAFPDTVGFYRLSLHDVVHPRAANNAGEDVAKSVGYIEQANDQGAELVRRSLEGESDGDVQNVQDAECDGGVIDREEDSGVAEVCKDLERVDEEHSKYDNVLLGLFLNRLAGRRTTQSWPDLRTDLSTRFGGCFN